MSPYYNMVPSDYWYRKNRILRRGIEKAFDNSISLLRTNSRLKYDCVNMFMQGSFTERATVVTLLKALSILRLNKISLS